MHFQTVHVLLLVFSLAASLFVLIAATRYAMWSRPMVNGSSSWLGLCAYVGFVPLTSLVYTITHLALLHFRKIPSFSASALAAAHAHAHAHALTHRPFSSPSGGSKPPSASICLTLLLFTSVYTLAWFAQSALCTACEMAPIASGRQGVVPGWCPQSRFSESRASTSSTAMTATNPTHSSSDRAAMLASLALAKDVINWVIFVAGLCMVECCRRAWKSATKLEEAEVQGRGVLRGYDPGVAGAMGMTMAMDAKQPNITTAATAPVGPLNNTYDFRNGYQQQQQQQLPAPPNPTFAAQDTKRAKMNSWFGIRAVQDVRVNLKVPGASYDTRV